MTGEAKVALPAVAASAAVDWRFGAAMGLGLLGGWMTRVGMAIEARKPIEDIRRDLLVSLMISGGSIIATLFIAQLVGAGDLGVASIGFSVALWGTRAVTLLSDAVLKPVFRAALRESEKKEP